MEPNEKIIITRRLESTAANGPRIRADSPLNKLTWHCNRNEHAEDFAEHRAVAAQLAKENGWSGKLIAGRIPISKFDFVFLVEEDNL